MRAYQDLLRYVLNNGERKENRTGVDTLSVFNYNYCLDFNEPLEYNETTQRYGLNGGFPLLTTKKVDWKNIVIELLWFLNGDTYVEFLERHNCNIWSAWADKYGNLGPIYGHQWRSIFDGYRNHDQIKNVLDILKTDPYSRRMVVSAWNPCDLDLMQLMPCHYSFVLNVQNENLIDKCNKNYDRTVYKRDEIDYNIREKVLNLGVKFRSNDCVLGQPYNVASYCLLLHLFAKFSGLKVGCFSCSIDDAHIYTKKQDGSMAEYDHVPGAVKQLIRDPKELPRLKISDEINSLEDLEKLCDPKISTEEIMKHFILENYDPHPAIKFRVAV
jgi:thymidylate synthase